MYVSAVEPQCVGLPVPAEALAPWLAWALGPEAATRSSPLLRAAARRTGIEQRSSCVADHGHVDEAALQLYRRGPDGVLRAPLEARMALFERTALTVARRAFTGCRSAPDHLLQVSCTGYSSPSATQVVAAERGWLEGTRLLQLGHMGCHAAVPALRAATDAVRATAARRDRDAAASVLHIELCSLHLQPDAVERDWIAHAALFGDGAARLDVTTRRPTVGFAVEDDFEQLAAGSGAALSWRLGGDAFRMHLGGEVVGHIRAAARDATVAFLARNGLTLDDIGCFALHPGGPRILQACAEALELPEHAYRHSAEVFRRCGNMSSATLPHIWAAMLRDHTIPDGMFVCSLAFGPGLTVTGNLLRVVRS